MIHQLSASVPKEEVPHARKSSKVAGGGGWDRVPRGCRDRGRPPRQLARQAETAKLLLARGADPNLRDNYGLSPIDSIRPHGYTEIEELLRQAGGKAGEELPPSPQSDRPRRE
jgi:hypothetical protein